jgi:predicted membrane chloride channel (bestrophin family)
MGKKAVLGRIVGRIFLNLFFSLLSPYVLLIYQHFLKHLKEMNIINFTA